MQMMGVTCTNAHFLCRCPSCKRIPNLRNNARVCQPGREGVTQTVKDEPLFHLDALANHGA